MHPEGDLDASRTTIASRSGGVSSGASAGGRRRRRAHGTIGDVAAELRTGRALAENVVRDAARNDRFTDTARTGKQIRMRRAAREFGLEPRDQLAISSDTRERHQRASRSVIAATIRAVISASAAVASIIF